MSEVYGNARVGKYSLVDGMAKIHGNANIGGSVKVFHKAEVCGNAIFNDDEVIHMETYVDSSSFLTKFKLAINQLIYGGCKKND